MSDAGPEQPETAPTPRRPEDQECSVCGFTDSGNFCSNCGARLPPHEARDAEVAEMADHDTVREGPRYVRTMRAIVRNPTAFFQGAFSEDARAYHRLSGTLSAPRFLVQHAIVVCFLVLVGVRAADLASGRPWSLLADPTRIPLDVAMTTLTFGWLFAVAVPLFVGARVVSWAAKLFPVRRQRPTAPSPRQIARAVVYASSVEIVTVPALVLAFARLTSEQPGFGFTVLAVVTAAAAKLVSQFWLLPDALSLSARVSRAFASLAITVTYAFLAWVAWLLFAG